MSEDPLAPFRGNQPPRKEAPVQASDEHRALKAAIDALNEIPNTPLNGAYKNTYALIPVLETVWENAERELRQQPQAHISMTGEEIEAAVKRDIELWQNAHEGNEQEPDIEP